MNKEIMLECKNLNKSFIDGKCKIDILQQVNMQVVKGTQIAIMGKSGSGKTTLLQLLGGLDEPSSVKVLIKGKNFMSLNQTQRGLLRNKEIGFIYQMHNLLPEFTAIENIAMPLLMTNIKVKQALKMAHALIAEVGLSKRSDHKPGKLSGGERQRVAIARALIGQPSIVLSDEPTGNLDQENSNIVLELIFKLNRERNTTFIMVTHDSDLANSMNIVYYLKDGRLHCI